jgi:hypothetical protein
MNDMQRSTGMAAATAVKEGSTRSQTGLPNARYCGTATTPVRWVKQIRGEKKKLRPQRNGTKQKQ